MQLLVLFIPSQIQGFEVLGRGTGVGVLLHITLRYAFVKIRVLPMAVTCNMVDKVRTIPDWPVVCELLTAM